MIAAGKRHEQISKIATTGIAQFSDVLETGERTARAVSNEEFALGHGAADKRTGDFFSTSSFISSLLSSMTLVGSLSIEDPDELGRNARILELW
jgi:hypothetical protein